MPSEADLVERFGVSRITVGRAVRDLRQAGLVERRAGSGTYVRPEKQADAGGGLTFGLLIPNLGETEIFGPICEGMSEAAGEHALLWGRASRDPELRAQEALRLCRQYAQRKVCGVFFAPLEHSPENTAVSQQIVTELDSAGIPVVLLDRCYLPYPQRSPYDLVGIDNRRAGYIATEHLLKLGCKRIGFWGYQYSAATIDARLAGYREALLAYGLQPEPSLIHRQQPTVEEVDRCMGTERAEAFVCGNDHTAGGLMHTLLSLGYRIPKDIRIVGIDDVRYASLLPTPLTSVRQPCRDIGVAAVSAMQERIAKPQMAARDVLLACHLIVRDSCGAKAAV